jgi:hypothetical protein
MGEGAGHRHNAPGQPRVTGLMQTAHPSCPVGMPTQPRLDRHQSHERRSDTPALASLPVVERSGSCGGPCVQAQGAPAWRKAGVQLGRSRPLTHTALASADAAGSRLRQTATADGRDGRHRDRSRRLRDPHRGVGRCPVQGRWSSRWDGGAGVGDGRRSLRRRGGPGVRGGCSSSLGSRSTRVRLTPAITSPGV